MSDEFDDLQLDGVRRARSERRCGHPPPQRSRLPELVADVYRSATAPLRAILLECLLLPIGPLALVVIAAGTFGEFLHRGSPMRPEVSPEDATRVSADQMLELARFVEQRNPEAFQQIASLMAEHPLGTAGVGTSVALMALQAWRRRGSAQGS
jgi:hypothetical protein